MTDSLRVSATYRLRASSGEASHRAQQLALEQSIEMLASSVTDQHVLDSIVARVDSVTAEPDGTHIARLALRWVLPAGLLQHARALALEFGWIGFCNRRPQLRENYLRAKDSSNVRIKLSRENIGARGQDCRPLRQLDPRDARSASSALRCRRADRDVRRKARGGGSAQREASLRSCDSPDP